VPLPKVCFAGERGGYKNTIDLTRFKMIENEMDLHGTKFLSI
jgi:hypothetical protein